jgi:aspartate-semialdehyde dehydrogenase
MDKLVCLASERSVGKTITFKGNTYKVELLTENSFKGIDIALFSAGGQRSKDFAPAAAKAGAVVIDNSSPFRMDPEVPLIIPEVNPEMIKKHKGIIANQIARRLLPMSRCGRCIRLIRLNGWSSAPIRLPAAPDNPRCLS